MLLLYTAFCVILLYLSDVSLLNRLLRFLTILRFDVSLPNGYPRFFVSLRCFALLFPSLYAIVSPILRYCFLALRYCFLRFTLLFPRFRRLFLPFCAIVSSLYAIVSFALRYCFLRFTLLFPRFTLLFPRFTLLFPLFALLFPRFTLWLCTLSDGCAYASLFADRGSIDHIDGLKCAQRYFFFNMTKIVPFLLIRRLSDPIVAARFADPLADPTASHCTAAPSAPQTLLTLC